MKGYEDESAEASGRHLVRLKQAQQKDEESIGQLNQRCAERLADIEELEKLLERD